MKAHGYLIHYFQVERRTPAGQIGRICMSVAQDAQEAQRLVAQLKSAGHSINGIYKVPRVLDLDAELGEDDLRPLLNERVGIFESRSRSSPSLFVPSTAEEAEDSHVD